MQQFDVDSDLVRKLAKLLDETGLGEIEYEANGKRVRVAKPAPPPAQGAPVAQPSPAAPAAPAAPVQSAAGQSAGQPADEALRAHPGAITSPIVGTVFLYPAPNEPPYAQIGDQVAEGQTIMLIEAMKTFNEIKAPRAGSLARVLVENGQPVEYGEVLALIE